MMRNEEDRTRVLAGHLRIMANRIQDGEYELSERQRKMLVTLINEINLERPEPKKDDGLER